MSTPEPSDAPSRAVRKFAVQPVETSHKSHKQASESAKPKRRFAPQLEETSTRTNHRKPHPALKSDQAASSTKGPDRPRPRFAPQLIETAARSRKRGDTVPVTMDADKTDASPGDTVHLPRHTRLARPGVAPLPPHNTPVPSIDPGVQDQESRFSYSSLSKRAPRKASARKPTLDCINSDDSDEAKLPSLSHSPSTRSDETEQFKHASRIRESCDDKFSGYLLALAARVAEKQLRDQVMAAYPNETMHEPVEHYAVDRDSDYSGEEGLGMLTAADASQTYDLRESAAGWDMAEMRRHKEMLEKQKQKQKQERNDADAASVKKPEIPLAGRKNAYESPEFEALKSISGVPINQPGELKQMRDAAKPPLLGGDIAFAFCASPQATMIDAYQKPRARDPANPAYSRQNSGLWTPITCSPVITRTNSSAGLWNGVCALSGMEKPTVAGMLFQTGILTPLSRTPSKERGNPLLELAMMSKRQLPLLPASPTAEMDQIYDVLDVEATLEEEFPDAFITQVYNYLSLGYPALAQKFDDELSKISRISLEDIRKDDVRKNSKGYVNLPEGDGSQEHDVKDSCGRWRALRLYIREWGRQEGRMVATSDKGYGRVVRRGSWLA